MDLAIFVTDRTHGDSRLVTVHGDLVGPERAQEPCAEFVFGSASRPTDFRCQRCHRLPWAAHPEQDWAIDSDNLARLALAAMGAAEVGVPVSGAMRDTLSDWAAEIAGLPTTLTAFESGLVGRFRAA